MINPFNWGVIGPGKIAHKFVQDLKATGNARLHAVASRDEDRAKAFAAQYGASHYYGGYEQIVTCPDLHAVYIATPHTGHMENTVMCLESKMPVLCEKPFAMNAREVREMIAAARRNDTFLMEALWTRFLPTTQKALEIIESGTIGEVLSVKADFGFKAEFNPEGRLFNRALGGGSLLDIGIYPAFLSLLILGKPQSIKAMANIGSTGVDEECGALLQYEGGKMAHLHSTILARTKTEAFIYGEKGTIHMHTRWHEPTSMSLLIEGERPEDFHLEMPGKGYHYEAAEVMKCLSEGKKESDLMPLSFSLDLIELLDAIREEAGVVY